MIPKLQYTFVFLNGVHIIELMVVPEILDFAKHAVLCSINSIISDAKYWEGLKYEKTYCFDKITNNRVLFRWISWR